MGTAVGVATGAAIASSQSAAASQNAYAQGYNAGASNANVAAANANAAAANANLAAAYTMGSVHGALPAGCIQPSVSGGTYYLCGNTWFQPAYGASGVHYTVVAAP